MVRRVCRLPGEERESFRAKVHRLRDHFEQFNQDAAGLCQWLMGLRKRFGDPDHPERFGVLGDFLLEPALDGVSIDESESDRWRLWVFDDVAGFVKATSPGDHGIPRSLRAAMDEAADHGPHRDPKNAAMHRLFERLQSLDRAHRLVLLKSAAEWVVARYQRGVQNWVNGRKAWEAEKAEWERAHPELTPEIRDRYTTVFKRLADPEREDKPGLRKKNPRICPYARLRQNVDNCCYAGQKGHGPLCLKYDEFRKAHKARNTSFNDKAFFDIANDLASLCRQHNVTDPANALQSTRIIDQLFARDQKRKQDKIHRKGGANHPKNQKRHDVDRAKSGFIKAFKANWNAYLRAMGNQKTGSTLTGRTAIAKGCLPHCAKIGGKSFEQSDCTWNPHTSYCLEYKRALTNPDNGFDDDMLALEGAYREWRRLYLAGPRKPHFRYPSARDLPMPKVFGKDYFEVDFDRSILRLRLEGARKGEWVEFGFAPWPRDYSPSRNEIADRVTSVHVHFVGTRPRVGFRFDVEHKQGRFTVTQDELDDLRSKSFPRQADDQKFLDAARTRLFETFNGDPKRDLRILTVDMGMGGAHAAVYEGTQHKLDIAIPIHKFDKLYTGVPDSFKDKKDKDDNVTPDTRGLRKEHVGRHLNAIADGAAEIAATRHQQTDNPMQTLREADFRGLKRHIRWMIRDWARLNARQIIDLAEQHRCDVIVFESLRGSRRPDYDKLGDNAERQKAERILYAYGQVRRKVTEKAVERGMRTVTAPYHKSSKVCSHCGREQENDGLWRKNKTTKKLFVCEHCQAEINSDANAARVLARVFLGEIMLPAPPPGGTA